MKVRSVAILMLFPAALVMGQSSMHQSGSMKSGSMRSRSMRGGMMKVSKMDAKFMMDAGHSNAAEIGMAKMALKMSTDDNVKQYAQQMIDEHTKMHTELLSIAKMKGVMVPSTPNAMQRAMAARLMKMKGKSFDAMYWKANVMGHEQALSLATKASKMAKDGDVRDYFVKGLPHIKMHLQAARAMKPVDMSGMGM